MRQAVLIFLVCLPVVANASDLQTDILDAYKSLGKILAASEDLLSNYQPKAAGNVRDTEIDLSAVLKGLPFVDAVKVYPAEGGPKRRIVHLANWQAASYDPTSSEIGSCATLHEEGCVRGGLPTTAAEISAAPSAHVPLNLSTRSERGAYSADVAERPRVKKQTIAIDRRRSIMRSSSGKDVSQRDVGDRMKRIHYHQNSVRK